MLQRNKAYARQKLGVERLEDRRMLAVLTVNNVDDVDIDPNAGGLTLREAIAYVNGDVTPQPGASDLDQINGTFGTNDRIIFAPTLDGETIMLSNAAGSRSLDINESMVIDASMLSSLTIDGGGNNDFVNAIIDVDFTGSTSPALTVEIIGLTVQAA